MGRVLLPHWATPVIGRITGSNYAPAKPEIKPMSKETKLLARKKIETLIEKGLLQAYTGLFEIWQQKLYAIDFKSFEEYLDEVWGYSKGQGYRLIGYVQFISEANIPPPS
jgi:hypothetical protein